jgi:hypothetical protein
MKPIQYKRKKENILFLLDLIKYFFNTEKKPKFNQYILKDQSFLSLIKNSYTLGFAYLVLKEFKEFQNTWLEKEIEKYFYEFYLPKEKINFELFNNIKIILEKENIDFLVLKEFNYKLKNNNYIKGSRFSNDLDILIKKKDLFKVDKIFMENKIGLRYANFNFGAKIPYYKDGNIDFQIINNENNINKRKKEILEGIKNKYRNFEHLYINENNQKTLLETHFFPNNYLYKKSHLSLRKMWELSEFKNNFGEIKPYVRIIYNTEHFFAHLKYHKIFYNGHTTFHCHLERICDMGYEIEQNNINWEKLIKLAKESKLSTKVFTYLNIGKKYLNFEIPNKALKQLKKDSNKIELFFINRINKLNILQDKRSFWVEIYARLFLYKKQKYDNLQ